MTATFMMDAAITTLCVLPLAVVLTGVCLMLSDLASVQFGLPRHPRPRRDDRRRRIAGYAQFIVNRLTGEGVQ